MKFTYKKKESPIVLSDSSPIVTHIWNLENSDFCIEASHEGVSFYGCTPFFQPEDGEVHLPVEEFREFMARLASAFDLSWKEQEKDRKDRQARKSILGGI